MQDLITKAATLLEALPYIQRFHSATLVRQIGHVPGGNGLASFANVEFP